MPTKPTNLPPCNYRRLISCQKTAVIYGLTFREFPSAPSLR
jgi:hypothetical protein